VRKKHPTYLVILAGLAGFLLALLLVFLFFARQYGGLALFREASKYVTVRRLVAENYVGDLDTDSIDEAVFDAMVAATGDRWSYYMTAEEYQAYQDYSANRYVGIGITVETDADTGQLRVSSVTGDSPAARAGFTGGMVIKAVDGKPTSGMTAADIRVLLQERPGEEIQFSVITADGEQMELTAASEPVFNDPVSYELLADGVGYIHIRNFETGAAEGAVNAVGKLTEAGAHSLLFDVRSNPGGKLSELLELLDYLLPEGEIFVSVDKDGNETVETSDASCVELPMAVLLNASTYSAAEFFAAVLSEYGWAVTVGEASTGKARSQVSFELSDGSAVHLSTRAYLTPDRVDLSEAGGLTPDLEITLAVGEDNQLQAAVDYLREAACGKNAA
jgi:carboxyl-terminal processing protease